MLVQSVRVFHLVRAIHEVCAVGTGPEQVYSIRHLQPPHNLCMYSAQDISSSRTWQ